MPSFPENSQCLTVMEFGKNVEITFVIWRHFESPCETHCFRMVYVSRYPCKTISLCVVLQAHSRYQIRRMTHNRLVVELYFFGNIPEIYNLHINFLFWRASKWTYSFELCPNWDLCVPGRKDALWIQHCVYTITTWCLFGYFYLPTVPTYSVVSRISNLGVLRTPSSKM